MTSGSAKPSFDSSVSTPKSLLQNFSFFCTFGSSFVLKSLSVIPWLLFNLTDGCLQHDQFAAEALSDSFSLELHSQVLFTLTLLS